jgi:hypothetical protein
VEEHRAPAVSLRSFAPRGNPQNLSVLHAYRLGGKDGKECNWVTLTFREVFRDGRRLAEDDAIRQAVIARLEFDAGSVLIGPESIRDKVAELFGPIDIDFRHETTFSRKYFVLADDEQRLRKHLPPSFMAMLSEESGVFARIRKHELLLARDRSIRVEDALQLARLGFAAMECR